MHGVMGQWTLLLANGLNCWLARSHDYRLLHGVVPTNAITNDLLLVMVGMCDRNMKFSLMRNYTGQLPNNWCLLVKLEFLLIWQRGHTANVVFDMCNMTGCDATIQDLVLSWWNQRGGGSLWNRFGHLLTMYRRHDDWHMQAHCHSRG